MMSRHFSGLILCSLLTACAAAPVQPIRVDGSSPAAFRTSWHRLVASLNSNQQARLNTAVLLIGATKLHNSSDAGSDSFGPETLRDELNGKTYREILERADATGSKIIGVEHRRNST